MAIAQVQDAIELPQELCGVSTSVWKEMAGSKAAKKDVSKLNLLPRVERCHPFTFQQIHGTPA